MKLHTLIPVVLLALGHAFPAAADPRLSDLLLQIERLQQEVQQLRGQLELQQHELGVLKRLQTEQYQDLDGRIQKRWAPPTTLAPDYEATEAAVEPKPEPQRAPQGFVATTDQPPAQAAAPIAPPETPPVASAAAAEPPSEEKKAYLAAFDLLKQRHYDDAVRAFEDLLARYPNGELADNARYWLGETYYVQRDYAAALTEFQRVLANYPVSPKVPGSMLKIGYIHYDQSNWSRARSTLQDVIKKFPESSEATLAERRLERMKSEGH